MNFLVDAQLPRRMTTWLAAAGCDAIHTLVEQLQFPRTAPVIYHSSRDFDAQKFLELLEVIRKKVVAAASA